MANVKTTRDKVKTGAIFALQMGNGSPGRKRFGAIGTNGKFASVNMVNGKLSFTPLSRSKKKVIVVGDYDIQAVLTPPSQHRKVNRSAILDSALFTVADGNNVYAHLGKNNDGEYVSLNLRSHDYAVGAGRGKATIVGSYKLKGQAA